MKTLISLLLTVIATSAMAADNEPLAVLYNPAQPLDIAKVVRYRTRRPRVESYRPPWSMSIIRARPTA